jgi:predicted phosphohydrolase
MSNNYMNNLSIDIVSDLHIDQWDNTFKSTYPCGIRSNNPYNFNDSMSDILIVAGDVSDDLDISLNFINEISSKYKYVLFVDGNHEHVQRYPKLFTDDEIYEKVKKLNNPKLFYLNKDHFRVGDTAVVGVCGWWDYNNAQDKTRNLNYFKKWMPEFTKDQNLEFINNVIQKSELEAKILQEAINKYNKNPEIKNIVVVTHTIPIDEYCSRELGLKEKYCISTQLNTNLRKIINEKNKISHWIFGHTHDHYECKHNNIHLICNPRGRPEDYNRLTYKLKTTHLIRSKL